jgi:cation diffusion facilitator family transporter
MVRTLRVRRSRAALRSLEEGGGVRVILIALAANLVVAAAKLIAGLLSGSVALLAEAAHSVADSLNQVLLGISLRRGGVPADELHPFGHGRERFLWAFLAALASFLIGGCLSIGLAIWDLMHGGTEGNTLVAWVVLGIAFAADGTSFVQSIRQSQREARNRALSLSTYLLRASDPVLRAVVVEDGAAIVGLLLAAGGLLFTQLMDSHLPDAIASLLIGVLLTCTAFGLAIPLADFLVGRSLPSRRLRELYELIVGTEVIEQILSLQAVYIGPDEVVVAAKVHPIASVTIDELTQAMDALDLAIRSTFPEVADVYLDVTTYRLETLPLDDESVEDDA